MTDKMFETTIGSKRYIHNNLIAFDKDQSGVSKEKKEEINNYLEKLSNIIKEEYGYLTEVGIYGMEVWVGDKKREVKAYLGYDESVDGNIRLNYATSTFLGIHLVKIIQKEDKVIQKESSGWKGYTFDLFKKDMDKKTEKIIEKMTLAGVPLEGTHLAKNIKELYSKDNSVWLEVEPFERGNGSYDKVKELLNTVSKSLDGVFVQEGKETLKLVKGGVGNFLGIRDYFSKNNFKYGEVVNIDSSLPFYIGFKKVMNILASNIGYKDLIREVDKSSKDEEDKNKEKSEDKEEEQGQKVTIADLKKDSDYYDFYIKQAGKWSIKGEVFIKESIKGIVDEYENIAGVSLLVKDEGDIFIDWAINKETVTMALTTRPREIYKLENEFDLSLAYDPKQENIVKELMLAKLMEKGLIE